MFVWVEQITSGFILQNYDTQMKKTRYNNLLPVHTHDQLEYRSIP